MSYGLDNLSSHINPTNFSPSPDSLAHHTGPSRISPLDSDSNYPVGYHRLRSIERKAKKMTKMNNQNLGPGSDLSGSGGTGLNKLSSSDVDNYVK